MVTESLTKYSLLAVIQQRLLGMSNIINKEWNRRLRTTSKLGKAPQSRGDPALCPGSRLGFCVGVRISYRFWMSHDLEVITTKPNQVNQIIIDMI
jgi:hypothetical protein